MIKSPLMERHAAKPSKLFHGTSIEIHTSSRPFLDPELARGKDDGDPTGPYIMATPDKLEASIFAFKGTTARSIWQTENGPIVVFSGAFPKKGTLGKVYEIPTDGFRETIRRGKPSGKWAILPEAMPKVTDVDGKQVPGISLVDTPVEEVEITNLIREHNLHVYLLADDVDQEEYLRMARDAAHQEAIELFVRNAVEQGWLKNVTDQILEE